jgi:hypothetical protein
VDCHSRQYRGSTQPCEDFQADNVGDLFCDELKLELHKIVKNKNAKKKALQLKAVMLVKQL